MSRPLWVPATLAGLILGLFCLTGCPTSKEKAGKAGPSSPEVVDGSRAATSDAKAPDSEESGPAKGKASAAPAPTATANPDDVQAAKLLLDGLGRSAKYTLLPGDVLTQIVVQDGSALSPDNIALFGKLTDLEKLQIYNCRALNDELAAQLAGLSKLTTLALTNSVINDPTVEMIAQSFPDLTDLDLSSNTNLTNSVMKVICGISKLQRLTLVQNRFNDVGTRRLSRLEDLRVLDLRGNMEAADMTLKVVAGLPKLTGLKHRSTAVSDYGMEHLSTSQTLESLLMQDFAVTNQAGSSLAKLPQLTQLEIFRCQGFGSEGLLALKGMKLTRLTLRDLPMIDDQALAVLEELPELRRLYVHEIPSISDSGLQHLSSLKSLEVLDLWTVPQMTDATVDVIVTLPKLKELSIRTTAVTDAAVEKLLGMENLQSLTFKQNGQVTDEALKKLSSRKWSKLDIGATDADAAETP
ncbi:MAG: hypothetical protein ACYC0X_27135 [Pirellulaceae bacterium]